MDFRINNVEGLPGPKDENIQELIVPALTSDQLYSHTKRILDLQKDETITYYIHEQTGKEILGSYQYSESGWSFDKSKHQIVSIGHSQEEIIFIEKLFEKLDDHIDLDFKRQENHNGTIIDIYSAESIEDEKPELVGLSIPQNSNLGGWWDIIWVDIDSKDLSNNHDYNTIIHEIGHALGLSHPFDEPDNKQWTTDDTVMSYNESADGWDIWFSNLDIQTLQSIWGRENDNGNIVISESSRNYKFFRTPDNQYKLKNGYDVEDITNLEKITFKDKTMYLQNDVKDIFNLITGIDDITGQIYRLYHSAFGRLPDKEGFQYWISQHQLETASLQDISDIFINSDEFISNDKLNKNNSNFLKELYENTFDRIPDQDGYSYWMSQLNTGFTTKGDILLSFSESFESKTLFVESTSMTYI